MNGASWAMEFQTKTMASSGLLIAARLLYGVNVVDVMKGLLNNEYLRWHMNEHGWIDEMGG